MNKLNRLYETLDHEERRKLFVLAMARRDDAELDLLEDSCPRKKYMMADYEFTRGKTDALVLTSMHTLDSYRSLTIAMAALATLFLLENGEGEVDADAENKAYTGFKIALSKFNAKEQAWREFCDEIKIDPKVMRQAFCIDVPWENEWIQCLISPLSADVIPAKEDVKLYKEQLHSLWARRG